MLHITNAKFYRLATLLTQEQAFEMEDMVAMEHILNCTNCTRKLKRATAIVESMDNIAVVTLLAKAAKTDSAIIKKEKAIIQIMIFNYGAFMNQVETDSSQWQFDVPLGLGDKRSSSVSYTQSGGNPGNEKLEDFDNSKTFIHYNPDNKMLVIQIDGRDGKVPFAKLKTSDGTIRSISFEKRGTVYRAEVPNLEKGWYELILEK